MSIAQRAVWRIDIDKGSPAVKTKNDLYQGDSQANSFACELYRGDTPVTIAGYTVTGAFDRSDGATVPCTGTATRNTAEVLLNEHCYRYSGPFKLSVQLTKGEESRTVLRIAGTVQSSGEGPVVDTDEVLVDLDEMLALVDETKAAAQAAAEAAEAANAARESITDVLNMTANGIVIDNIEPKNIVNITNAASRPAVELLTFIEPHATGAGWETIKATRNGKNILSRKNIKPLPYTVNGVTFEDGDNGKIMISGTATATATLTLINRGEGGRDFLKAGTYTVSGSANQVNATVYYQFYESQEVPMSESFLTVQTSSGSPQNTFELSRDCFYGCYISVATGRSPSGHTTPKLEVGTEATEYAPHDAETLIANLPEMVYGGTLRWKTGELVSTMGVDGNALNEPKVFQLAPQNIDMLRGINNVWSDCGQTQLVYIADTQKYIDEKFAAMAAAQLGV